MRGVEEEGEVYPRWNTKRFTCISIDCNPFKEEQLNPFAIRDHTINLVSVSTLSIRVIVSLSLSNITYVQQKTLGGVADVGVVFDYVRMV